MNSPLDEILNWFKNLPPVQQTDVAFLVSYMPGLDIDLGSDEIVTDFLGQIDKLREGKVREQALIVCLKALIENFIISKRIDPEGWKKRKAMLEQLSIEKDSQTFAKLAERKEFEGAQWVSSCKKWNEMAKNHLTDEKIDYWFDFG
ncbi:hypothetical protein HX787_26795 [Pseudomonas tolaasii]|uniref:Uncharacterized protein n=1 Tax=Pseudomonas tolaasii TaxID=29442 RepID=A0A7Y8DSB7_PSETO|nr:hypothetical protein [Pseudomonas tolaasii]MBY8939643.1 hypothetical protein [Pseudomonas tolaasii]NWC24306.1 hypothetical protein [Pseudomonas tolaasii]NWD39471.1 hypothetical protein [Pseudomonas tolaasii]